MKPIGRTLERKSNVCKMSAVIICFAPSAGGNHLKNIISLDHGFSNARDLDPDVYDTGDPPGTVHSVGGRNVKPELITGDLDQGRWILHGHWAELAPWRKNILDIKSKQWILITIDDDRDRALLERRQERLGDKKHPWYLQEEQPLIYHPLMIETYFQSRSEDIMTLSLYHFWNPNLEETHLISRLNRFLGIDIDHAKAQDLHSRWWRGNFMFDFCTFTGDLYGQTNTKT